MNPEVRTKILIGIIEASKLAEEAADLNGYLQTPASELEALQALLKELEKANAQYSTPAASKLFHEATQLEETFVDMIIIILALAKKKQYFLPTLLITKLEFNLAKARVQKHP